MKNRFHAITDSRAFLAAVKHKARPPRIAQHTLLDAPGIDPPTSNQWIICGIMSWEWTTSQKFPLKSPGLLFSCTGRWRDCLESAEPLSFLFINKEAMFFSKKHHNRLCYHKSFWLEFPSTSGWTLRVFFTDGQPPLRASGCCKPAQIQGYIILCNKLVYHRTSWGS